MKRLSKKQWMIVLSCIVAGYFAGKIPGHITISKTNSVKPSVFWTLSPDLQKVRKGHYVRAVADIELPNFKCNPCSIVKRVGCLAGDYLNEKDGSFFCNGELIAKAQGDMKHFLFNGTVPSGKYFLIGDHPRSYDSRYFGFIEKGAIDARLIPLF
jgi:conjugal transfer pilin signal peptidase TrbI